MRSVCIKVCTEIEAAQDLELLTAGGIRAVSVPHSESVVGTIAGYSGEVEILVREADIPAARELLGLQTARPADMAGPGSNQRAYHPPTPLRSATPADPRQAVRQMLSGLFWLLLGLAASWLTYQSARSGGGTYVLFIGTSLWGLLRLVNGAIAWLKIQQDRHGS